MPVTTLLLDGGHYEPRQQDQETLLPGQLHAHRVRHRTSTWHIHQEDLRLRDSLLHGCLCDTQLHPLRGLRGEGREEEGQAARGSE